MTPLIHGQGNIRAAILTLSPASQEACRTMIGRLPPIRNIHQNHKLMLEEMVKCMAFAGANQGLSREETERLIDREGLKVVVIAGSIMELQQQQQPNAGWGTKAAGLGIGFLLGALFG
jgi:hypothetical protein